jgi:hypothetical protein
MDHFRIIKRAWQITWNYRILWIFGFLLALTTGGMNGGGGSGSGYRMDNNDFQNMFPRGEFPGYSDAFQGALSLLIPLACLGVFVGIVFVILRYVSEISLFRMVNRHEEDDTKYSFKEGFRLGWSRSAFKLFLMDLLVSVIGFIIFGLLFLIAAVPLLVWTVDSDVLRTIGTLASVSLGLIIILIAILTAIVISLVLQFSWRILALENRGVIESLKAGFNMVRSHLSDSIIMGLILFGIGIAFFILMIPVMIMLVFFATVVAGLPGLLAYWLASLALEGAAPYMIGFAIGIPLFLLILVIPSAMISGLFETFKSSVWTLTYREFRSLDSSLGNGSSDAETVSTSQDPAANALPPLDTQAVTEDEDADSEASLDNPPDEINAAE